jgi:Glycosyl hydrolase catalytic core
VQRVVRVALFALAVLLVPPAASVSAAPRMPVGFYDDPSFRWAASPEVNFASAQRAHASVIHVLADWSQIATRKPAAPLNGDDPAYDLSDLDAVVRTAPAFRLQVVMTISGTPKWANGGQPPNRPPKNLGTLTQFAHMLAARYNGLRPGFGSVSRWSVWNEPNLELFLKPQFEGNKIVSPKIYAKLFMAAYKGIKAGNPLAEVAAGETSNRGRNKPSFQSGSVAPATFARMLAEANPKLPFAAWATHPYPTVPRLGPKQKVAYPNVTMTRLEQFGKSLEQWFHRRVPIWVTEYAEQTRPEYPGGVTRAQQAADAKLALKMAAANPYVEMFVWFVLRDSTKKTWFSGLIAKNGARKPAYSAFAKTASGIDGQTQVVVPGRPPTIKLDIPYLTYNNSVGAVVGITYVVLDGRKKIAVAQPRGRIASDQTVSFVARFKPVKGKSYLLSAVVNDKHGQIATREVSLVAAT